jgi:hypothetical protein
MYKLSTKPNTVIRLIDNAYIQFNELNPDYLLYLDWVKQGNTAVPAEPTPRTPDLAN